MSDWLKNIEKRVSREVKCLHCGLSMPEGAFLRAHDCEKPISSLS